MLHIAVIGSNGFIGRALSQRLASVPGTRLSLFGRGASGPELPGAAYHMIRVDDTDTVKEKLRDADLVYYLASESIPASSWNDPMIEIERNLKPFLAFHTALEGTKVRRVVFVSSAGTVYGPSVDKIPENADKHPFSPYGITKLCMENYLNYFEKKFGYRHDIYRVSNVYGPGQDTSKGLGIINTFLENIVKNGSISIFGDGSITRNYIHIDDVAEYMTLSTGSLDQPSGVYNLASAETLTINDLVAVMKKVVPEKFEVNYLPSRLSDNAAIVPDNSRISAAMPAHRPHTIEQGIRLTFEAIKKSTGKHV